MTRPYRVTTLKLFVSTLLLCLATACGGGGDGGSHDDPATPAYTISGSVSHLDSGSLTISDGSETLTIGQGSTSFAFSHLLTAGTAYGVTVATQPDGEACVVENGSGTVSSGNIQNVAIVCNTVISQPVALGVIPVEPSPSNAARIFVPVSMVGNNAVAINAILDTGSAGTILNALNIFPPAMVTMEQGFMFPAGRSSITYNGITVTNLKLTREYGPQSNSPTLLTGNLGFAQLTFGTGTRVTTAVVPIFFAYQSCRAASSTTCVANASSGMPGNFGNLLGVNPAIAAFPVVGSAPPATLTPCTPQSTSTCGAVSPLRYLTYANGIDDGFVLNRVTLSSCAIDQAGSCPQQNALVIGVDANVSAGFSTVSLSSCRTISLPGSLSEPACSQVIPGVKVSSGSASFTGPAIFDSGYPTIRLSVPQGAAFPGDPAAGTVVDVAAGSGFAYQFTTGMGYLSTQTVQATDATEYSNLGIAFFTLNGFLLDYSRAQEGWRAGS